MRFHYAYVKYKNLNEYDVVETDVLEKFDESTHLPTKWYWMNVTSTVRSAKAKQDNISVSSDDDDDDEPMVVRYKVQILLLGETREQISEMRQTSTRLRIPKIYDSNISTGEESDEDKQKGKKRDVDGATKKMKQKTLVAGTAKKASLLAIMQQKLEKRPSVNPASKPTKKVRMSSKSSSTPSSATRTPSSATRTPTSATKTATSATKTPTSATKTPTSAPSTATRTPTSATKTPTSAPSTPTSTTRTPTSAPSTPTSAPTSITSTPCSATRTPTSATNNPTSTTRTPISATRTPISATRTPTSATSYPRASTNVEQLEREKALEKRVLELEGINLRLQNEILDRFKGGQFFHEGARPFPEDEVQLHGNLDYVPEDGQVSLGFGIFMPEDKFSQIKTSTTNSLFVKNLSVAVWGSETLAASCLEGKTCPRYKNQAPKPRLDSDMLQAVKNCFHHHVAAQPLSAQQKKKEMDSVKKYIREKMMDLCRREREKKKKE